MRILQLLTVIMYILSILTIISKFLCKYIIYNSSDDALLRKAFTDIVNCCDIYFIYILNLMANFLNRLISIHFNYCIVTVKR